MVSQRRSYGIHRMVEEEICRQHQGINLNNYQQIHAEPWFLVNLPIYYCNELAPALDHVLGKNKQVWQFETEFRREVPRKEPDSETSGLVDPGRW